MTRRQRARDIRQTVHVTMRTPRKVHITNGTGARSPAPRYVFSSFGGSDRRHRRHINTLRWMHNFDLATSKRIIVHGYGPRVAARYQG